MQDHIAGLQHYKLVSHDVANNYTIIILCCCSVANIYGSVCAHRLYIASLLLFDRCAVANVVYNIILHLYWLCKSLAIIMTVAVLQ